MANSALSSLVFIIQTLGNFYILICLLRFILPLVGVSFINPISQLVQKATNPAVNLLRMVLPPIKGVSTAALVWAYLAQLILLIVLITISGQNGLAHIAELSIISLYHLIQRFFDLYFYALIILVITSFVAPMSHHPGLQIVRCITEPILKPIRNVLPAVGVFDFSVLVAFIILNVLRIFLSGLF